MAFRALEDLIQVISRRLQRAEAKQATIATDVDTLSGTVGTLSGAVARLPYAAASGTTPTLSSIASNGSSIEVEVDFPVGLFTSAPVVTANCANGRGTCAIRSVTTTGATIGINNWSNGTMAANQDISWQAIQTT